METEVKKLEKYIDIYDIFRILMSQDNFKDNKISFLDSSLKNKYGKYSIIGINPHLELKEKDNKFYTNGGRVLNVVSIQDNLEKAIESAYKNVKEISFKDNYYRKDIGTLYVPIKY